MLRRTLAIAIALAPATCARRPAPDRQAAAPTTGASSAVAPPVTAAVPPATAGARARVTPTPAPPESVTPIDTGLARDAVLMWPIDSEIPGHTAVVLFPDELTALRRAVGRALGARGIAVVPIAKLELIEDAAAAGKLALEDDLTCASPLSRAEVVGRYFTEHPKVAIEAACWDDCRLTLTIERTDGDADYFSSRAVRRPEDPQSWISAAAQLTDDAYGMGGLGLVGTSHSPPIRFGILGWVGSWPTPPTDAQFTGLETRASACAHVDPLVAMTYAIRASVDRRGRIDRCVADGLQPFARDADELCLCEVMRDLRFKPGSGKRRLRVEAIDDAGFAPAAGTLTLVQPGTEPWIDRLSGALALEHCAAVHPLTTGIDAMVSLDVAVDGRIDDVRIEGDIVDPGAMRRAQCVAGELRAVALPCSPPGIDVLRAKLVVTAP